MATFHWCSIVSQLQVVQLAPSSGFVGWLNDIRISTSFFKIKYNKNELLVVAFKTLPAKVAHLHLNVGGCSISHTFLEVCELGVNLDSALLFPSHVKSIFKSALYHPKNFSRQWPSFSDWNPHSYLHHLPPRLLQQCTVCLTKPLDIIFRTYCSCQSLTHTKTWLCSSSSPHLQIHTCPCSYMSSWTLIFKMNALIILYCKHWYRQLATWWSSSLSWYTLGQLI